MEIANPVDIPSLLELCTANIFESSNSIIYSKIHAKEAIIQYGGIDEVERDDCWQQICDELKYTSLMLHGF